MNAKQNKNPPIICCSWYERKWIHEWVEFFWHTSDAPFFLCKAFLHFIAILDPRAYRSCVTSPAEAQQIHFVSTWKASRNSWFLRPIICGSELLAPGPNIPCVEGKRSTCSGIVIKSSYLLNLNIVMMRLYCLVPGNLSKWLTWTAGQLNLSDIPAFCIHFG